MNRGQIEQLFDRLAKDLQQKYAENPAPDYDVPDFAGLIVPHSDDQIEIVSVGAPPAPLRGFMLRLACQRRDESPQEFFATITGSSAYILDSSHERRAESYVVSIETDHRTAAGLTMIVTRGPEGNRADEFIRQYMPEFPVPGKPIGSDQGHWLTDEEYHALCDPTLSGRHSHHG